MNKDKVLEQFLPNKKLYSFNTNGYCGVTMDEHTVR